MSLIWTPKEMLEFFILIQLAKKGEAHGYALASWLEEEFGWNPSLTSIYNALKSMYNKNFVTYEERIESSRVQKIYSITDQGRAFLEEKQRQFKTKFKKKMAQFFSLLETVDNLEDICSEKSSEAKQSIFSTLRQISQLLMLITNNPRIDFKTIEKILTNTLSALKEIAEENNIPTNIETD